MENHEIDGRSSHEKLKNQIENCQKALQELSLDVINREPKELSSSEFKFNSNFLLDDFNLESMDSKISLDNFHDSFLNEEDRQNKSSDKESNLRNVTINIENANPCSTTNENEKTDKHVDDESSDEDPPFWKSSIDGGYFIPQIKREDTLR